MNPAPLPRDSRPSLEYDPRVYWQSRLTEDFNLAGVGSRSLGIQYNRWLYRSRVRAVRRAIGELRLDITRSSILDIGSGTGFWVDFWRAEGARDIIGIDIAQNSVVALGLQFPDHNFYQGDITSSDCVLKTLQPFDVVGAFDVLFHVVDEDRFDMAISNIARSTSLGGYVMITDGLLRAYRPPEFHCWFRTFGRYGRALEKNGLAIVDVYPMFFAMNTPIDVERLESRVARCATAVVWTVCRSALGRTRGWRLPGLLLGAMLYLVDGVLLHLFPMSPCEKLLVAQRVSDATEKTQ